MNFELKDLFGAIGPTASIVFAAWIFMSFLQNRYSAAFQLYRSLIQQCRDGDMPPERYGNVRDQILLMKHRFELMRTSVNLGIAAAILLIATLVVGGFDVVVPGLDLLRYLGALCALFGFLLVIVAAILVIRENSIIQRAIDVELLDIPDLAQQTGQRPGDVRDPNRPRWTHAAGRDDSAGSAR